VCHAPKNLFHHQTFTKPITAEHKSLHRQNKFTHATQLYNDWRSKKSKRIYSNRLGIEYTIKYQANGEKNILTKGNRFMYRKKYMDFKFTPAPNPRTRKKQKQRFTTAYNRIFKINKQPSPPTLSDQLIMAKRSWFLFLDSQFIDKPISHLKYKKSSIILNAQDYNYLVPFFTFKLHTPLTIKNDPPPPVTTVITQPSSSTKSIQTNDTIPPHVNSMSPAISGDINTNNPSIISINNFIPLPDGIKIREHLRPFVPQHPIYNKKKTQQHVPGSALWFRYIKKQAEKANTIKKLSETKVKQQEHEIKQKELAVIMAQAKTLSKKIYICLRLNIISK
jgi:hypothetical protein